MDVEDAQNTIREIDERMDALDNNYVPYRLIENRTFTERELRIMGWAEDKATHSWRPFKEPDVSSTDPETIQSTELAVADDQRRDLAEFHGSRYVDPLSTAPQFSSGPSRHHRPFFDDYNTAKILINQALGDMTDVEVFDKQVICAVFVRPNVTSAGIYLPISAVKEDWWQHKVVLIIKCGPSAFSGDESYLQARFGDKGPPKSNDWVFARPESGMQVNLMGEGGSRPQGKDHRGAVMDIFEWDGWPCRIIPDEDLIGRLPKPHSVV